MKKILILICFILACLTQKAQAAVLFSEIAWMGSPVSSADEWVELFNSGNENINLDGFVIESQSKKISISLSGQISSGGYFIIERTDDASEPTVGADLIASFGTGLNNSGDNIYLKDGSGQIIDSLLFSAGWPAGDNTTKDTMQKLSGAWVTMTKSPKSAPYGGTTNSDKDQVGELKEDIKSTNQTNSGSKPEPKINLSRFDISILGEQLAKVPLQIVIDNRDQAGVPFNYGIYKINFGDGFESIYKTNESVIHTYEYNGFYKITVRQYASEWSVVPIKENSLSISITDPQISIDTSRAPIVVIKNNSNKDIDLGQFILSSGSKAFRLPKDSIIFANKELWLSPNLTGFTNDDFKSLSLNSISGDVIYQNIFEPKKYFVVTNQQTKTAASKNISQNVLGLLDLENVLSENLTLANVNNSDLVKKQKPSTIWAWFLFGVLLIGGSMLFLKIRKSEISASEEFSFLEE